MTNRSVKRKRSALQRFLSLIRKHDALQAWLAASRRDAGISSSFQTHLKNGARKSERVVKIYVDNAVKRGLLRKGAA